MHHLVLLFWLVPMVKDAIVPLCFASFFWR